MMRIGLKNNHIVNKSTKFGRDNQSYYMIPTYTQLNGTMGQSGPMVLKYNKDFIMHYFNHKKEPSMKGSKGNKYV